MRRRQLKDTTALGVASVVSGALAYAFFVLATRSLAAEGAAPVSVLWSYWSASAALLTFPLQHWITRTVVAEGGEGGVRRALPGIALVVAAIALAMGGLAWVARDQLFARSDAVFPALVAAVTFGSGFVGVVRGGLAARGRFLDVGWALIGENGVRCVIAAGLAATGAHSSGSYGIALACGPLIGLLWPSSLWFRAGGERAVSESPVAFLGGIAGGSVTAQGVLTGGPVVLSLIGGRPADVTALFAALALFRAPYQVALGLVTPLTGHLTRIVASGRVAALRQFRRATGAATAGASVGAAAFGWAAGNPLLAAIFGPDIVVPRGVAAAVAAGSTVALGSLVATITLVARGRGRAVLLSWMAAVIAGAATLVVVGDPLVATASAFVVSECVALAAMLLADARAAGPSGGRTVDTAVGGAAPEGP